MTDEIIERPQFVKEFRKYEGLMGADTRSSLDYLRKPVTCIICGEQLPYDRMEKATVKNVGIVYYHRENQAVVDETGILKKLHCETALKQMLGSDNYVERLLEAEKEILAKRGGSDSVKR